MATADQKGTSPGAGVGGKPPASQHGDGSQNGVWVIWGFVVLVAVACALGVHSAGVF